MVQPFGSDSAILENADSAVVAKAAGNAPSSGSVTQSSNGDGAEAAPTTTDVATATIGVDASTGELQWTVEVTDTEATTTISVSSESDDVLGRSSPPDSSYDGIELFKQEDGGGRLWVDVYTDFDPEVSVMTMESGTERIVMLGDISRDFPILINGPGTLNGIEGTFECRGFIGDRCNVNLLRTTFEVVEIFGGGTVFFIPSRTTTTTYSDDSDYLAGGIWVYAPDDAAGTEDYEFGAFVDGNDPFTAANLDGLTGQAEYMGVEDAAGVYTDSTTDRNSFFYADVALTANFDTDTISGMISNFYDDTDDEPVEGNPSLTLGTADINTDANFFTGDTSMTFDGDDFAGKWGGQFYRNGANATDHPGSVAGTFGGATADDTKAFLGVFGADRQ
jgi:hypothetical protein